MGCSARWGILGMPTGGLLRVAQAMDLEGLVLEGAEGMHHGLQGLRQDRYCLSISSSLGFF